MKINEYLNQITEVNHKAGGGSVAALNGALAASLIIKAYNMLLKSNPDYDSIPGEDFISDVYTYQEKLGNSIKEDGESFGKVLDAWALPKNTDEEKKIRSDASQIALKGAVLSPYSVMENSVQLFEYIFELSKYTDDMINTELFVAKNQIISAYNSAKINFEINLVYVKDKDFISEMTKKSLDSKLRLEKSLETFNKVFDKEN